MLALALLPLAGCTSGTPPAPQHPITTSPAPPFACPDAHGPIDGTIAFEAQGQLLALTASGGEAAPLLTLPQGAWAGDLAWSPDGRTLAFTLNIVAPDGEGTAASAICALDRASGAGRLLARGPGATDRLANASWSPDGRALLVTALLADRPTAIARYDLATGTLQPLVEGAISPALSPDGQHLAFIRLPVMPDAPYAALAVAGADGAGARAITGPETRPAGTAAPRWSPDNRRIIFAGAAPPPEDATPDAARPPADGILWLIGADGQDLRRLTDAALVAPRATWDPDDGDVIAYTGGVGLMARELTTGQERRLAERGTYSNGLAWGADGRP